jgi:hypothetical protein
MSAYTGALMGMGAISVLEHAYADHGGACWSFLMLVHSAVVHAAPTQAEQTRLRMASAPDFHATLSERSTDGDIALAAYPKTISHLGISQFFPPHPGRRLVSVPAAILHLFGLAPASEQEAKATSTAIYDALSQLHLDSTDTTDPNDTTDELLDMWQFGLSDLPSFTNAAKRASLLQDLAASKTIHDLTSTSSNKAYELDPHRRITDLSTRLSHYEHTLTMDDPTRLWPAHPRQIPVPWLLSSFQTLPRLWTPEIQPAPPPHLPATKAPQTPPGHGRSRLVNQRVLLT